MFTRMLMPGSLLAVVLALVPAALELQAWLQGIREADAHDLFVEHQLHLVRWCLHARQAAVQQLAHGRLSLLEAAAWERALDPRPSDDPERYCQIVLQHLAVVAKVTRKQEDVEALLRERAELDCQRAKGPLVLPEPPELPRVPPRPESD